MGTNFSKPPKRHTSNRVLPDERIDHTDVASGIEEIIKVPDATTKHKKSKSLRPFTKKSFMSIRKTSSLQSAVQTPKVTAAELENLRRENEQKKIEIQKLKENHREEKHQLNEELTRLRSEVRALNNALRKVRADKDKAQQTEKDALERANFFEQEREKIQRQFKLFREAKEVEVITILKEKQSLTNQLRRHVGNEGSIQEFLTESVDLRHAQSINEWLMDGHSGSDSHHQDDGAGAKTKWKQPHSPLKDDHRARKEICKYLQSSLHLLHHACYGVPLDNVYSTYVTSSKELSVVAERVVTGCRKLMLQLEAEGRLLTLSYFLALPASNLDNTEENTRDNLSSNANIILVFLDENVNEAALNVVVQASKRQKICLVASVHEISRDSLHFLENGLDVSQNIRMIHGEGDENKLMASCIEEITRVCTMFYDKQLHQYQFERITAKVDYKEMIFHSYDTMGIEEQFALQKSYRSTPLDFAHFGQEFNTLNSYITQHAPATPLLITSEPGAGTSRLLSHWITSIEDSLINSCILYHTAAVHSAYSRDPLHIIRRFMYTLVDQLPMFFNLQEIEKDFTRWLDRACSKYQNGVVIVIDGADLIYNNKDYFKWLLDPLPVPVRVVISVSSSNHPEKWSTWNKLPLGCDHEKAIMLCNSKLKEIDLSKLAEDFVVAMLQDEGMLTKLSNHLFRDLLFSILSYMMSENEFMQISSKLKCCKNVAGIFLVVIEVLETRHPKILVKSVLSFVYLSMNGVSLMELQELHDDPDLFTLLFDLRQCCLVSEVCGLFKIIHLKGKEAIATRYKLDDPYNNRVNGLRTNLAQTFQNKTIEDCFSYRVADELPELLISLNQKEELRNCMKSVFIFIPLYRRGRLLTIVNHWKCLGVDLEGMHTEYMEALQGLQKDGEFDVQLAMLYDLVGEFFKDLGQYKLARLSFEKSLEMKELHVEPEDITLQQSYFSLGKLFTQWKKFQTAEDYLKQALDVKEENEQQPSVTYALILESFAALYMMQDKSNDADLCRRNAASIRDNDFMEQGMGFITKGLKECDEIVSMLIQCEHFPSEDITDWLIRASHIHFNMNNFQEAAEVLQAALQYLQNDVEHEQDHQAVADVMVKLSFVYTKVGQNDKAEGVLENALSIYFKLNLLDHPNLHVVINSLVKLYKSQKRMDSLERLHRAHYEALEKAYGPTDTRVAEVINSLGVHLSRMGKVDEAIELFERSMQIYIDTVGFQHQRVSVVLGNLAKLFYEQREVDNAAHYYKLCMDPNRVLNQLKVS